MLAFMRPSLPPRTNTASQNPIFYDEGRASVEFHAPDSEFSMTHVVPPTTVAHGPSILQPPMHYHIYQAEHFRIKSGMGTFFLGTGSKPFATLSTGPGAQSTTTIPAGRYHRFENASQTEDLVLDIALDPQSYEKEQSFFRNFFGYIDDCNKASTAPSVFQLMVFLHSVDGPLALPLPSERLGVIVSRVFMIVMAAWGRWVLGYKRSYEEYYDGKSA